MVRMLSGIGLCFAVLSSGTALAQWEDGGVGGSFRRSCTEVEQRGSFLRALCRDRSGELVPATADTRECGRFANRNGRLVCEGGGARYAPPPSPPDGADDAGDDE